MTETYKKKLIETSLPLEAINAASAREKSIRHGHPSTLHLYWARRPLATARAVLFAQLVDDPASRPEEFPTVAEQDAERARLHALLQKLIVWENSNDESILRQAQKEIRKSNNGELPKILDPFAGGGSIPLEAQRLGLQSQASDLNPLAVLINKALIEIPPKFSGARPVHDGGNEQNHYQRAEGLAEDIRFYGRWMRNEAQRRIGHLYPTIKDSDGIERTVIAWVWARTVKSPNPAYPIETPLVRSWWLSKRKGKEAWIQASVQDGQVRYKVQHNAEGPTGNNDGTRTNRKAFSISDGTPISTDYLKSEGTAGRMGTHLIAIIAEGNRGRIYLSPTDEHEQIANIEQPQSVPDQELPLDPRNIWTPAYGLTQFSDLFTPRQLVALTTLSELVEEARQRVLNAALAAGMERGEPLETGGEGALAYADTIATYLALAVSRQTDRLSSLASWQSIGEKVRNVFARQAIPMVWDYAEANPFSSSSGNFLGQIDWVAKSVRHTPALVPGKVMQVSASERDYSGLVVSTDPPYYDNIGYSDLSDYFYVWLRQALGGVYPELVGTMLTPKADELVANPYRHDGKDGAQKFFINGFNSVFARICRQANTSIPMTVYYAYKQQDSGEDGTASTGWHTLLDGLIAGGWEITATWPVRSERGGRMLSVGTNALASSIVLACRPRPAQAPATTRRAFSAALKAELPEALRTLIQGVIAPVDLAQAAIGPGIAVFSRYAKVRNADGTDMSVKDALQLINATLDEVLDEQESEFDSATRFCVKWYRQYGWGNENSGIADQLARAYGISIGALERGEIFEAKGGKARLLSPEQLSGTWDPIADDSVSVWEATVRLAAIMKKDGIEKTAQLLPAAAERVGAESIKELGFLLFHEAEKKKDTRDAVLFNALVSAWSELTDKARTYAASVAVVQQEFDFTEGEN